MSFINLLGNSIVQVAQSTYSAYTLTTATTQLIWPNSFQDGEFTASRQIDITSENAAYILKLPAANLTAPGQSLLISNVGVLDFVLQDYDGNELIAAINAGEGYYIYLTDNSDTAGTWRTQLFGAGTSSANASELAGLGLTALLGKLNTNYPVQTFNSDYVATVADRASFFIFRGGTNTFTLPTTSIPDGYYVSINNESTIGGQINMAVEGGGTIDEQASFSLSNGESSLFIKSGSDYFSLGYGKDTFFTVQVFNKNVAPGGTFNLLDTEAQLLIQNYTGALTSNVTIVMPDNPNSWHVYNNTSGAFTLTVKTTTTVGVAVDQGTRKIIDYDGTNTYEIPTPETITSISLGDGTSGAPSLNYASETDFGYYRSATSTQTLVKTGVALVNLGIQGLQTVQGSVSAPAFGFLAHTNKAGLYTTGDQIMNITDGVNEKARVSSAGVGFANGAAATPSINFFNSPTTGFSRPGADRLVMSSAGTSRMELNSLGVQITQDGNATTPPFYWDEGASNTGFYKLPGFGFGMTVDSTSVGTVSDSEMDMAIPIHVPDGSLGTNSLQFGTTNPSGFYFDDAGTGVLSIAVNGSDTIRWGPELSNMIGIVNIDAGASNNPTLYLGDIPYASVLKLLTMSSV